MKQVAVRAGVIGRRLYEPGDQFDHAERMNWASLVEDPAAKPDKKGKPKAAVPETDPPGEDDVI